MPQYWSLIEMIKTILNHLQENSCKHNKFSLQPQIENLAQHSYWHNLSWARLIWNFKIVTSSNSTKRFPRISKIVVIIPEKSLRINSVTILITPIICEMRNIHKHSLLFPLAALLSALLAAPRLRGPQPPPVLDRAGPASASRWPQGQPGANPESKHFHGGNHGHDIEDNLAAFYLSLLSCRWNWRYN